MGGKHKHATVSAIGMSINIVLSCEYTNACFLDSVRINVDELLRDQELAMAKPKSKLLSSHSSSSSPRKRKSDENDTDRKAHV